ncbi:MAG: VOC family protein [Sulfuricaulis sp.]|uniref:VOC family protein n=1 Tax=Sulfuricaulis sp. TaxID=2003553 RepID=UPI0034A1983E
MKNPVNWFEIYVQDMARAKKFYESVFGVALQKLNAPTPDLELWSFPMKQNTYGASGALVKMKGFPSGSNSTIVYFHCLDCSVEASRVTKSGGRIQRSKMPIGEYGFISLVYDTEGNMIGLHSMK